MNFSIQMSWTYILKGKRYYIGSTLRLIPRLKQHRRGHTSTTKRIGEWRIVWQKQYSSLKEARRIEVKIKKWKSVKMIDLLIQGKIDL